MKLRRLTDRLRQAYLLPTFTTSGSYWDKRYRIGGSSGEGSYGERAQFKAAVLNAFVADNAVRSVIEFGCGDGAQLTLAEYPTYLGLDVATGSIQRCRKLFHEDGTKTFIQYEAESALRPARFLKADLTISLDVIYHLVEEDVYEAYLSDLFEVADRFVVIYSTNEDRPTHVPHVRHREFTKWIASVVPEAELIEHVPNPLVEDPPCDFYVYARGR